MSEPMTRSVVITHDVGLHARPSVKLTKLAKGFAAKLEVAAAASGPWVDAKSIVRVMALKVPQHGTLHFRAAGADASEALGALVALVEADFEDTPGHVARG